MAALHGGNPTVSLSLRQGFESLVDHLARPQGPLSPDYAGLIREAIDKGEYWSGWNHLVNALSGQKLGAEDRERLATYARKAGRYHFVDHEDDLGQDDEGL